MEGDREPDVRGESPSHSNGHVKHFFKPRTNCLKTDSLNEGMPEEEQMGRHAAATCRMIRAR